MWESKDSDEFKGKAERRYLQEEFKNILNPEIGKYDKGYELDDEEEGEEEDEEKEESVDEDRSELFKEDGK